MRSKEQVSLNPYKEQSTAIFTAEAVDADETATCPHKGECPCGEIRYSFGTGNDNGFFNIDSVTGQVTVSPDYLPIDRFNSLPLENEHRLQILAANPDSSAYDKMELLVSIPQSMWNEQVPPRYLDSDGVGYMGDGHHHIHKRAITLPDNVTFTLTKTGESENVTEMRVGTKVSFRLQILFPLGTTDMLVELFAPDNDSIVMMLCDVNLENKGVNLNTDLPGTPVMDSQNSSTVYFDRAILDFGNVTNTAACNDESECAIVITWDAVMIQNDATVHDAVYWVSAGAEYNYEMEVWVGQASFSAKTDANPNGFGTPLFNLSGPSSMMIGESAVFTLDMYITKPSVGLSIDAFAPLNNTDVMSICGMKVVDTGANYKCGFKPEEHVASAFPDSNTRGNGRYRLELGTVTNKGARDTNNPSGNNRITVQFLVHLYEDATYVGNSYWVGAAVEIGTTQIWAGEITVNVLALTPTASIVPTWDVTKEGSGKVSTVAPLLMTLDITIPVSSVGKYSLEVLAPFNESAAVFQLCAIRIVGMGDNLACTESEVTPTYTSRGDPLYTDRGYVDMGVITNVGTWGWQPYDLVDSNATAPDVLRVQFLVKATNHSLATVGSTHAMTLGLIINDNRLLIGSYFLEVEAAAEVPNVTEETTPDWNLTWKAGAGNVTIGGAGQFLVTISTKRNTVYSPFDLEALMPNSTGATQVSVCKVQVASVGKNLPCLVPSAINSSISYTWLFEEGLNDRAVLNLPSVCNYELVNDTLEDNLVLKVSFMLQPDAGLTADEELWPSVGVMYSPFKMWVGQIKAIAKIISPTTAAPHVHVTKNSGVVPVGYVANYHILIKTSPSDFGPYSINVTVSDAGLSVCSVKILQVGDNMPCVNGSAIEATYEQDALTGANTKGSLDFGVLSNVGADSQVPDSNIDDNSIVVEVMIGLTSDTAVIADNSNHAMTVAVNHNGASVAPTVGSFTAVHDQSTINSTATNVTKVGFNVVPVTETDNGTNVVLGQSKRFQLCVWTYPQTITKLTMKMLTPVTGVGLMEATYIGVSHGGKNVPCAGSCKAGVVTYETRTGSPNTDIATVDLGYLYNNNFDPTDEDNNKVCVDGVFRVLKNNALTIGGTVEASASVNVNDEEITIIQLPLTIEDNATFTDIYPDNVTLVNGTIVSPNASMPDPLCLTPGDVQTFPLLLSVPPNVTSLVTMDIKLDVNVSACMTYKDVRLVGVGKNLRGFGKDYDLTCTPNSTMSTTQMDMVECSFGVVTNPGMSHRCSDVSPDDDAIYLEVDVQLADCPVADKDANLTASFGFKVGGYIAILNYPVMVCRDLTEAPVYNITALANSTGSDKYINFDIRLDNTSKAEIHNASLVLNPPPYVLCNTIQSSSGTNMPPTADTSNVNRMVIDVGSVYFTDALNLVVMCSEKAGYKVPSGVSGSYTVISYQMAGFITERDGSTVPPLVWSDMDFVNFTATTVSDTGVACTTAPLNVQSDTDVFGCQISGSPGSLTPPINGRKGGTGWVPYVHEGELKGQRYFQVYFPNKVLVDRVEVDQTGTSKATKIKMAYSNDGKSFLDGSEITLAGTTTEVVQVSTTREAKVVRIYVTEDSVTGEKLNLQFELYGCEVSTGGPTGETAICAEVNTAIPPQNPDALFYRRSFLALTSGSVFVCDGVVKTKGVVQRCFMSPDGTVWQPLDPRVASMVGHESDTNRVYALSQDGVTHMSSDDNGMTWASIHKDVVTTAKGQSLFVVAQDVPWTDKVALTPGDPEASRQLNNWGVSFDALKKNNGAAWDNKVKWDCCN
ncbi:uncharacterized protein [Littorina saxatilis]|uniref:uncharacterized protein n=1 Tax=Littorina saxatilis TaxID=31220 RepID=UPI0038B5B597